MFHVSRNNGNICFEKWKSNILVTENYCSTFSGYIPSSVYTRSQYRSQQYPTLSTRSQSVPADEGRVPHPRTTNGAYPVPDPGIVLAETPGGLYNIPQQRTSLACHSLDDLGTPTHISNNNNNNIPQQSHHNHHHQPYRPRNDSQDRCG